MKRRRDLIVTNVLAMLLLATVALFGWWDAAGFGLVVLVIIDLAILLREHQVHVDNGSEADDSQDGE